MTEMNDELKSLYEDDYVERFDNLPTNRVKNLVDLINTSKSKKLLDVGCGKGLLLHCLNQNFLSYTGIDFSSQFITKANHLRDHANIENATFICDDVIKASKRLENQFDLACMLDFTEHVYEEQLLNILIAVKNTLKKGGELYIHTPNLDFFVERMKDSNFILKQFPEHVAVRNMNDNCAIIERAGFSIQEKHYLPHYNILKLFHFFSFLPFIGKYFRARLFIKAIKHD